MTQDTCTHTHTHTLLASTELHREGSSIQPKFHLKELQKSNHLQRRSPFLTLTDILSKNCSSIHYQSLKGLHVSWVHGTLSTSSLVGNLWNLPSLSGSMPFPALYNPANHYHVRPFVACLSCNGSSFGMSSVTELWIKTTNDVLIGQFPKQVLMVLIDKLQITGGCVRMWSGFRVSCPIEQALYNYQVATVLGYQKVEPHTLYECHQYTTTACCTARP